MGKLSEKDLTKAQQVKEDMIRLINESKWYDASVYYNKNQKPLLKVIMATNVQNLEHLTRLMVLVTYAKEMLEFAGSSRSVRSSEIIQKCMMEPENLRGFIADLAPYAGTQIDRDYVNMANLDEDTYRQAIIAKLNFLIE
jgi:hypothetical protein